MSKIQFEGCSLNFSSFSSHVSWFHVSRDQSLQNVGKGIVPTTPNILDSQISKKNISMMKYFVYDQWSQCWISKSSHKLRKIVRNDHKDWLNLKWFFFWGRLTSYLCPCESLLIGFSTGWVTSVQSFCTVWQHFHFLIVINAKNVKVSCQSVWKHFMMGVWK